MRILHTQAHMRGGLNWKNSEKKTMESTVRMENSEKARARSASDSGEEKRQERRTKKAREKRASETQELGEGIKEMSSG